MLSEGSYNTDAWNEDSWEHSPYTTYTDDNPLFPNARLKPYFRTDLSYSMERKKRNGTRTWQVSLLNATAHINPYAVYNSRKGYQYITLIPFLPSFSYKRTF